jgi:hypothetical protein
LLIWGLDSTGHANSSPSGNRKGSDQCGVNHLNRWHSPRDRQSSILSHFFSSGRSSPRPPRPGITICRVLYFIAKSVCYFAKKKRVFPIKSKNAQRCWPGYGPTAGAAGVSRALLEQHPGRWAVFSAVFHHAERAPRVTSSLTAESPTIRSLKTSLVSIQGFSPPVSFMQGRLVNEIHIHKVHRCKPMRHTPMRYRPDRCCRNLSIVTLGMNPPNQ